MRRAFLIFLLTASLSTRAEAQCKLAPTGVEPQVTATASTWANFRRASDSITVQAMRLLQAGDGALSKLSEDCQKKFNIVLNVVPNQFLDSYSDKEVCEELFKETRVEPLKWTGLRFLELTELNRWFGDFSAGKGKEGTELYEQCPGNCSPQYRNIISKLRDGYILDAHVICGPARDKDDNQYRLSYGFLGK